MESKEYGEYFEEDNKMAINDKIHLETTIAEYIYEYV